MSIVLIPGILETFRFLQEHPIFVPFIITNQSGIARGLYTDEHCIQYTDRLISMLREQSGYSRELWWKYAPSYDDKDPYFKPNPEMILELAREHYVVLKESYIIGDSIGDLQAGASAHLRGYIHRFHGANIWDLLQTIPEVKYTLHNWKKGSL